MMKKEQKPKQEKSAEAREKVYPREWTGVEWWQAVLAREILGPCRGRKWFWGR